MVDAGKFPITTRAAFPASFGRRVIQHCRLPKTSRFFRMATSSLARVVHNLLHHDCLEVNNYFTIPSNTQQRLH